MKERLLEILPEINEITDADLRERVINVWLKAFKVSGFTPDDLLKMPFTLLYETKISFAQHIRGVVQCSISAGKVVNQMYAGEIVIKMDILIAGAILHDVAKLLEFEKTEAGWRKSKRGQILRHPFAGVGLCFDEGIPDEVMHIIAVHSKEGDGGKRTPEAWILNHCDFINFDIFK